MKILVTGSRGFIGQNLMLAATETEGCQLIGFDKDNHAGDLTGALGSVDAVVHLAGVNRPTDEHEFWLVNLELTRQICNDLMARGRRIPLLLSSSTQAALSNPYGESKRAAEEEVRRYAERSGSTVAICRLPGVFGKWCKPYYNSVVATFCYNATRNLPLEISDPGREIELVHVNDVVHAFLGFVHGWSSGELVKELPVEPRFCITLGRLAALIGQFRDARETLEVPDMGDPFIRRLIGTYQSYLPANDFGYTLVQHQDKRGTLAELLKSEASGQMFISRTKPGVTRGHHYHHTKVEKFFVVEGDAVIRFRHIMTGAAVSYAVSGTDFRVVDIPPGWAHSIENVGSTELIVVFWASERFNRAEPDTYRAEVRRE